MRFEESLDDAETFRECNGRLLEIGARPISVDEIEGQFMGLLKFTETGWGEVAVYLARLPLHEQKQLDMTGLLQRLLAQGANIDTVPINDRWFEVDSASDLARYQSLDIVEFAKS